VKPRYVRLCRPLLSAVRGYIERIRLRQGSSAKYQIEWRGYCSDGHALIYFKGDCEVLVYLPDTTAAGSTLTVIW
jgi:hypothetical protein